MYYIVFVIITIIAVSLLFQVRNSNSEYFTQKQPKLSADKCGQCAGYCQQTTKTPIPKTLLPKFENSYVIISPSGKQSGSTYLDFLSPGVAKDSSVFLRQQTVELNGKDISSPSINRNNVSVEQPMKWFIEPVDNYVAYIRTYDLPYYYLFANKDGSVGVSLFRGNDNQKWSIIAPGFLIGNAMHGGYLSTNSDEVVLAADPITNWDISIA